MSNVQIQVRRPSIILIAVLVIFALTLRVQPAAAAVTYNVMTYGATGNGVTDDTVAIQNTINAVAAAGGGTVFIPVGTYLLDSNYQSAHGWFFYNISIPSNITLQGETGSKLLQGPNGRHACIVGAPEVRNTVLAVGKNYVVITFQNPAYNGGFYSLSAIHAGDTFVTLSNPGDASHFAIGDYVAFYEYTNGDVIPSQTDKVTSVNTNTGQLGLKYSAARSFSTPSIAKVTSLATENVAINNLIVEGAEPLAVTETFNFFAQNNQFLSDTSIGDSNDYSLNLNTLQDYKFIDNTIADINGPYAGLEYTQRNSQNGLWDGNTFDTASGGFGEYAAHVKLTNNHIWLHPAPGAGSGMALGGFDVLFSGNDVHGGNLTGGGGSGAFLADVVSPDFYLPYTGKIRIINNTIDCQADGNNAMRILSKDTVVFGNQIHVTGNAIGMKVETSLTNQAVHVEGNTFDVDTASFAILVNSPVNDGSVIINNAITGSSGSAGIYVVSPPTPNGGGHTIYGNSVLGYTSPLSIDMAKHPGTILAGFVVNPGFESAQVSPGWTDAGTVTISDYTDAHTGGCAAILNGANSSITQHLTGLTPNTTYTLSAWGKVSSGGVGWIGVRNQGNTEQSAQVVSTDWTQVAFTFTTGASSTTADIYAGADSGSFYVDDYFVALGNLISTTYTVTPAAGGNGTITPNTPQTVNYGANLALTAKPNSGYWVDQWFVDGNVVQTGGGSYTLTDVTANHNVSVTFKVIPTYTLTPSAGANGTITPNTVQTVKYNGSVALTAKPNTGYWVDQWYVDGVSVQFGGSAYSVTNVTANHTVSVTFKVITRIVTPSAGANGAISPSTAQSVNNGGSITFTATPNVGYAVNQWSLDGVVVQTGGATYTLSKVTAAHSVSVTFKAGTYTVTPSAGANGTITPNTAQTVSSDGSVALTAKPNTGYWVDQWYVDGVSVQAGGSAYSVTNVTANHTVNVTFKVITRTVTPSAGANGAISPSTVQAVNNGGSITFTATPNTGYVVDQWSVGGVVVQTGGTTYSLTNVTANKTISVTFKVATYTVTPSAGANGTISPNTAQTANYGGSITFTATPNTGYIVDQWSVDGGVVQAGGTTYSVTNVTANHTISVTFKLVGSYTVTPSAGANGTITPNTAQTVASGGSVSFTATPNSGYWVDQWYVDGVSVRAGGSSYSLTNVTANHAVSVTFKVITRAVTPSAGANGAISPSTVQTVNNGGSITFTATPDTGYVVDQWSVGGVVVQTGGTTYTLTNVTANKTISVTFKVASYTVTPSAGANGTITPNTAQTVSYNGTLALTAKPNTGYWVDQWYVDGVSVRAGGSAYSLLNVTANHNVSVTFKQIPTYTVTPSAGANGTISPNTAQTVNYNGSKMFTATPNSGYGVDQWSVDGSVVQTGGATYSLTTIVANHSVSVTFK